MLTTDLMDNYGKVCVLRVLLFDYFDSHDERHVEVTFQVGLHPTERSRIDGKPVFVDGHLDLLKIKRRVV